jgi:hypothetical protein
MTLSEDLSQSVHQLLPDPTAAVVQQGNASPLPPSMYKEIDQSLK